jgi:lipopolysaccharide transport system permease protein
VRTDRAASSLTRIRPPSRWVALDVGELLAFRELAWRLARRDVSVRYRQTALGLAWVVLQPLLTAGAFTLVFNRVIGVQASDGVPYFLLAYWGATCFTAFSQCLSRCAGSLVNNTSLVEKVYFPRLLLPLSAVGAVALDTAVAAVLGLALTAVSGVWWGWHVLALPLVLLAALLLGLAVGVLCAPLIVRYRDVGYVLPLLTQLLLYVSPVGYTAAAVPGDLRGLYLANPLAPLVETTRWAALATDAPGAGSLLAALLATGALLVVATYAFRRQERTFADVI